MGGGSKMIQIPSKISQKRSQIDENASLERFRCQFAPRSASRSDLAFGAVTCWSPFGRKWCSKGPFWSPAGTQNPSKIAFLGLDRAGPLENQCFSMARNHVWRYTLRLF